MKRTLIHTNIHDFQRVYLTCMQRIGRAKQIFICQIIMPADFFAFVDIMNIFYCVMTFLDEILWKPLLQ